MAQEREDEIETEAAASEGEADLVELTAEGDTTPAAQGDGVELTAESDTTPAAQGDGVDASADGSPEPEGGVRSAITFAFGIVGLLTGLAALAAIPILQFMTLGWMLEAEARVGKTGSLRGALPGLRKAARIGSVVIGLLLIGWPLLIAHYSLLDARLLDPTSPQSTFFWRLRLGFAIPTAFLVVVSIARGGRLMYFFRPLNNLVWLLTQGVRGRDSASPADAVRASIGFVKSLRLSYYLVLGVKGFVVGAVWLVLPGTLLFLGGKAPPLFLLGLVLMPIMLPYVLVAQARLADTGELRAAFRLGEIRRRVRRAPISHTLALVSVLGLALPLYLLKVEELPRDTLWLPAVFFVAFAIPGRLLTGWAHYRGRQGARAHGVLRFLCWNTRLAAGGFYVFVIFFWQFFGWRGAAGIYAQHAFLLPIAFY